DLVAVRMEINIAGNKRPLILTSAYLPYDSPSPPPIDKPRDLVNTCRAENLQVLIVADANSHHITWSSKDNNKRGESLLEFILTTNLEILNRGNEFTFVTSRRSEVIATSGRLNQIRFIINRSALFFGECSEIYLEYSTLNPETNSDSPSTKSMILPLVLPSFQITLASGTYLESLRS
ncbi:unnamed protein product, partial [Psylliodes chrysocephalus]